MPFAPRSRAAIAASYLANLAARFFAKGIQLLIAPGSDDSMRAEALAMELEGLEAQAAANSLNIFPDTADEPSLEHHGVVEGLTRVAAVATTLSIAVTGAATTVYTLTGQTLQSPAGLAYLPVDSSGAPLTTLPTTDGSGDLTLLAKCALVGTTGNLSNASVLTWSSTPTGMGPTGVVVGTSVTGAPQESPEAYAARIVQTIQARPASGNRQDWRANVKAVAGVSEAFVYPLLSPAGVVNTLGCVTIVAVGPPQGTGVTNTRVLDAGVLANIRAYIEGTGDALGAAVTDGMQLRPVTIAAGDYTIATITETLQDVEILLTNNTVNAFPFASRYVVVSGTANTVVIAGDHAALSGVAMLIFIGTAVVRGGFVRALPVSAHYDGGSGDTTFTFEAAAFAGTPSNDYAGYGLYPAPPNWSAVVGVVFDYFDALGSGNAAAPSARWPTEDATARATLYRNTLQGLCSTAGGVLTASIPTTPGADVTPTAKHQVILRQLVIRSS